MRKLNPVTFAVSACISLASLPVLAETVQDDQQKIIITGSHIKRLEQESSSPLAVIDREDIDRSGVATLAELLQTTVFSNGASLNNQQTGGFTPGASSYNLRGLRADRTLVLVDGKRLPSYPFGQDGSIAFVNLNTIPLAEVESVEILKDGASAVYGSDAISGVVNIITKREFTGNTVTVKTTQSNSNYNGNFISFSGGTSNESNELLFIAEFQDYDSLLGKDLKTSSQLDLIDLNVFSYPGSYVTADTNGNLFSTAVDGCERVVDATEFAENVQGEVCVDDWAKGRQLIPENKRSSVSVKWSHYLGENTIYAGLSANQIKTDSDVPFGLLADEFFIPANSEFNPIGEDMLYYRGFTETGLQSVETDSRNYRIHLGIEGFIFDFDYDVVLSHGLTQVDEVYKDGWMHQDDAIALLDSVNNGEINPFESLTAEQIDFYTSQFTHKGKSYNSMLSGHLSGELTELENGSLYFASGVEFRKEYIRDKREEAFAEGKVVGLGNSSAEGERDIVAVFAEFIIPATQDLEMNLALRYDNYSDFGSSLNPKASLSYTPIDSLLVRASWGTGFRAPNLFELHSDEVAGFVGPIPFFTQANPDLEAETSESINLGLVFDINERFMASFDIWQIEVDDIITNLGVNTILTTEDESGDLVYADLITYNPDNTIAFVTDPFLNLDSQKAQGIDISSKLSFTDSLHLKINASHLIKLQQQNKALTSSSDLEGEYLFPENRVNMSFIWEVADFEHVLLGKYTGSHGDEELEIEGYSTFDYQLNYQYDAHQITFMVANLADEEPPTNKPSAWPYYEQRMYSPLGRTYSLQWKYDF